mgnify:CR=1 FL=1
MVSFNVTLRSLALGAADAYTGWHALSRSDSTIKMIVRPKGASITYQGVGFYAKYTNTGFTNVSVVEGDEIKDSVNRYFEIKSVDKEYFGDAFSHYVCELSELPLHADRPATSGTWATVDDPQYRQKVYLDTYLAHPYRYDAYLTKDNGTTPASYHVMFSEPDYPLTRIFSDKAIDVVFAIQPPQSTPIMGYTLSAYGYKEKVPIDIYVIDKVGITAKNLLWKAQQTLRAIQETYPIASVRQFEVQKPNSVNLGSTTLYSVSSTLEYTRGVT